MNIFLNHWNNNTEKNEDIITHDASEGMPTPPPKRNEAVGREGEEDESGSYSKDKGFCSVVS